MARPRKYPEAASLADYPATKPEPRIELFLKTPVQTFANVNETLAWIGNEFDNSDEEASGMIVSGIYEFTRNGYRFTVAIDEVES